MIRRFAAILLGIVIGGGVVFSGFQFHVVRTTDHWYFVPKNQATLKDAYVDIRGWTPRHWSQHPDFAQAMMKHGHGDLVQKSLTKGFLSDLLGQAGDIQRN